MSEKREDRNHGKRLRSKKKKFAPRRKQNSIELSTRAGSADPVLGIKLPTKHAHASFHFDEGRGVLTPFLGINLEITKIRQAEQRAVENIYIYISLLCDPGWSVYLVSSPERTYRRVVSGTAGTTTHTHRRADVCEYLAH